MYKPIRKISFIVLITMTVLLTIVKAETISLVADEWPPFNDVPNSENEGFVVEVARAI